MPRSLLAAALVALVTAGGASAATGWARVVDASGRTVATADGSSFDYPADGALVHVGSATVDASGVTLNDVALLGGLVRVGQVYVPPGGSQIQLSPVAAAGRLVTPRADTLVSLGQLGYVVLAQKALARGRLGRVGLRLVLQAAALGVPAGTEVLVGIPVVAAGARPYDPLAVLGFGGGAAAALGFVPPPQLGRGSIGEQAVALAEQFLGAPYVWGGADPLTGFDCSGLALYVYGQLGVRLTHYTGSQFEEGLRLPRALLEPGDLVFFDLDPVHGPQHEGIYIGDGRFVQAPHTGDVVRISRLDDPRYGFAYVGAVRPYVAP